MYSAGYDIKNELEQTIRDFDEKIGLEKVWVIHVNDSCYGFNSRKDRHANIGKGELGFASLQRVVHNRLLNHAIKLLETPRKDGSYREEVKLLRQLPSHNS